MHRSRLPLALLAPLPFLLLAACGDDDATTGPTDVAIQFAAVVGDAPFACGETYTGLGITDTTFEPLDFRLYVSSLEVRGANGAWQPLALDQDTPWQHEGVALLDFEDATGRCANGTPDLNDIVTGLAPGAVTGLRFDIGVPFELNHIDASTAPSPLNQTALFWNWLGGYKFIRLEGATDGLPAGWQLHLGSTACVAGDGPGARECANGNRIAVTFPEFDPAADTIVLDVAALLADADLDQHTPETPRGCMAGPQDPDCTPVFEKMGLAHGASPAGTPSFLRLEQR
ncbi:MAG: metallo-mystery pair system four-Cys motif protein [Deltaproteobacteria bacterium]|nr:MAG: metallo-mystery pair system four-Cys motif protein [Deltaproteobacteria bacterium]